MEENAKRLDFLTKLMSIHSIGRPELAKLMETTPQNIFTYFKRDDMKLSYAMEIAKALGYTMSFSMDTEDVASKDVVYDLSLLVGNGSVKKLTFLRVALAMNGIESKDVAEKLGLNYTGVNKWFKVDDIALSYVFSIADAYGFKFHITVKPNKKRGKEIVLL